MEIVHTTSVSSIARAIGAGLTFLVLVFVLLTFLVVRWFGDAGSRSFAIEGVGGGFQENSGRLAAVCEFFVDQCSGQEEEGEDS